MVDIALGIALVAASTTALVASILCGALVIWLIGEMFN